MKSQDLPVRDAPLAVNEQVIVMSGHETIRVLEVGVDASLSSSVPEGKTSEGKTEGGGTQPEGSRPRNDNAGSQNFEEVVAGKQQASSGEAPAHAVHTLGPTVPISVSLPQPPMATVPVTVQGCPQVLSQENLATLMTGMLAQTGSLGQPLLIPISMAGSIGGQGGLAVLTLPTTSVATLSGLAAAAATQPANLLKMPFAGLQVYCDSSKFSSGSSTNQHAVPGSGRFHPANLRLDVSVHTGYDHLCRPRGSCSCHTSRNRGPVQHIGGCTGEEDETEIHPNYCAQINAASLGAQTQFLSSLTSSPIITNAMSNMAGITSQILTTTQGQVIGTLPFLVNPASLAGGAATSTLPLQGLQVQTVTPQLLLNTQGQIFAAVGNGAATVAASTAVLPKAAVSPAPSKPTSQTPATAATQLPVVIAPQPSVLKSSTSSSSSLPITCGEMAKVGQLVSKPHQAASNEEGINLEEIREFAKNFKIRRLSLGLTQTQVGQALTATEGPAYSQSAICRFEKLDITPKSAQKLKPVLEKWLAEAEHWNQKGQQNLMEFVGGEPSKKRKRRTSFTPQAIEVLNSYFEKNSLPTGQEITEIAKELNYDREVVRVWFCNRRQTLKNTSKINIFQVQ
ncbi:POU domain, class 6, transcription factor 1 [Syngnathus acus]|uniref:POU domain, class 6, transcription factor 1 n=1 Tax=Syngnathus acus TaxID=161584 RepID=UPI001886314C|nr:POU domain, class 6, transcription factor 1 [Syngnathus acus]